MINHFFNLSCYEEFEIQATLSGISKIDILKAIGHQIGNYYFFISKDGIFNWFDLEGNYIEDLDVLKELKEEYIPENITKCIIPNCVTYIGNHSFYNCKLLKEIIIPNSVTYIGYATFAYCRSLPSITIPDTIISIGDYAFCHCNSLTSITIPENVTHIGRAVFICCTSLKEVIFKGKTLEEIKRMDNYPWGIRGRNIFKFS